MRYFILFFMTVMFGFSLNAQIFDTYDENIIKSHVFQLFDRYEHLADFTEDGLSFSEDYQKAFEKIFVDTTDRNIYNDLQSKGNYISAMEYSKIAANDFPHGLETTLDSTSIKFLQTKLLDGDNYSIEVVANKYVVGITNENKIHRIKKAVHFIIHFKYFSEEEEFDNFLIASITNEETLLKRQSDQNMQGIHAGIGVVAGVSNLYLADKVDGYNRSLQFPFSYTASFDLSYFFNSNIAVSLGFGYSVFNTKSSSDYNNNQGNNLSRTDRDGDNYYLYVDSKINEKGSFQYMDIPVNFIYRHGLSDKISFYASLGFISSFLQSSELKVNGESSQSGFYPEYNLLIDDADLYNFGNISYDNNYVLKLTDIQFGASVTAGVSMPVGKQGYFNAGLSYRQNITNMEYDTAAYRDDFLSINGAPKSAWLQFLAVSVSYTYKIFSFSK